MPERDLSGLSYRVRRRSVLIARGPSGHHVIVTCERLRDGDPPVHISHAQRLYHYADRFDFGSLNRGCAQLGLALLADAFGDQVAKRHHESFCRQVLARAQGDEIVIAGTDLQLAIDVLEGRVPIEEVERVTADRGAEVRSGAEDLEATQEIDMVDTADMRQS